MDPRSVKSLKQFAIICFVVFSLLAAVGEWFSYSNMAKRIELLEDEIKAVEFEISQLRQKGQEDSATKKESLLTGKRQLLRDLKDQ